nr:hypothetical protein [Tanacetum cinerariifolium]
KSNCHLCNLKLTCQSDNLLPANQNVRVSHGKLSLDSCATCQRWDQLATSLLTWQINGQWSMLTVDRSMLGRVGSWIGSGLDRVGVPRGTT